MKTEWRRQGHELVAKVDCSSGKRTLKDGGIGWFEVGFIEWRFDWKPRVQVSVTEPRPGHPYNDPQVVTVDEETAANFLKLIPDDLRPQRARSRPGAQVFAGPVFVTFVVERDIVEVIFPVPDCIHPFHNGGWGCAEGKRIELSSGRHHCQALVEAKPPNYKSTLRRCNNGIEFVETESGRPRVIGRLEDSCLASGAG